jgi:L-lactate dehydrogenase complex protein LldG
MSREGILTRVRTALGRTAGQPVPEPPPVYLRPPSGAAADKIAMFSEALEALAGKAHRASSLADAKAIVSEILAGRTALLSSAPILAECGLASLPRVAGPLHGAGAIRDAAATADVGITGADYGLAETGTLVMFSSAEESRLISLLPPCYIAILPIARLLANLDELLSIVPRPAEFAAAMVLITGPSRTADIEQILIRGVHGPGEVHVVLVEDC